MVISKVHLFLLGHVIGDFYVQNNSMSEKKENSIKWVLIHSLAYFATMILITIPVLSLEILIADVVMSIMHSIIDILKFIFIKAKEKQHKNIKRLDRNVFLADQMLHVVSILGISFLLEIKGVNLNLLKPFETILDMMQVSGYAIISWALSILLVHKPANILIQKLIKSYKPETGNNSIKKDNNIGRIIGTVERLIMLVLMSINQYSAIGLVLTAKSIARYDRISKDEEFAEYYLLGTLISTIIVIVVAVIIR